MSNSKQHTVYRLIQSMDATEKAYFKKFAFKRDNKNNESFISIFDEIDKQSNFDIQALQKIRGINIAHKSKIHAALNNLFKLICQTLIDYRKDRTNIQKLFFMLEEYELFKDKNLADLAEKKLCQMENFVEECNLIYLKPYIYQIRGTLLQNNISVHFETLHDYLEKLDASNKNLNITIEINKLSLKLEELFHKNGGIVKKSATNLEEAEKLIQLANHIIQLAQGNFLYISVAANNRFIVQMISGKMENIENYIQEYLNYFDSNIAKHSRESELGDISVTVKNFAVVASYLHMPDLFIASYKRLEKILGLYSSEKAIEKLNFRLLHLRILNFVLNKDVDFDYADVERLDQLMKSNFLNKSQHPEALLPCMIAYLLRGEFEKSLQISEDFILGVHNERIRDEYISIRLLRAISWFKKDAYELYQSEINSIYRKLLSIDNFPFQLKICRILKKINKVSLRENATKLKKELVDECQALLDNGTGSEMMKAVELRTIGMLIFE
ncbi:MAG: hypothetical protein H6579_03725 [Chitinophagales bacterium]|nr:hypothetical protein [Chitinophagales bacterium]